jgi:hypothetical protein
MAMTVSGMGKYSGRSLLISRSQLLPFSPGVPHTGLTSPGDIEDSGLCRKSKVKTANIPTRLMDRKIRNNFWRVLIAQEKSPKVLRMQSSELVYPL